MLHLVHQAQRALEIYPPDLSRSLDLPFVNQGISAGFPSPADDFLDIKIDLNKEFIKNPNSTFYARVRGSSMIGAGLRDGDLLIIDRSLEPEHKKIAVCFIDGEFTVKRIKKEKDNIWLMPENKEYPPIKVDESNDFVIWGVVTTVIKKVN
ncbi:LexA family protein [Psychroflexus salinarum]|uniref:LexA family protein n=1 Tax=Psychroflexus salinarum TaxID=546024 RepID=A0ABW3GNQ0_9FLAO